MNIAEALRIALRALRANRLRAFEQLNFAVGKPVFRTE